MKHISLIALISYWLLFSGNSFAIGRDTAQIQIVIVIPEQPENLLCTFSYQLVGGLRLVTPGMRNCEINFVQLEHEINRYASHPTFLKTQNVNKHKTITLEVTVQ